MAAALRPCHFPAAFSASEDLWSPIKFLVGDWHLIFPPLKVNSLSISSLAAYTCPEKNGRFPVGLSCDRYLECIVSFEHGDFGFRATLALSG